MTNYVGCGVLLDGKRQIKTKAQLKRELTNDRGNVSFDVTDLHGQYAGKTILALETPADVTMQVVGPDPYSHRRWYASVTYNPGTGLYKIK